MQKEINDIEKTWYEITVALTVCDFLGAMQRIRKMGYQLKLLRLEVGLLADLPYPELVVHRKEIEYRQKKGGSHGEQASRSIKTT